MRQTSRRKSISVPDGWEPIAFFGRLLLAGLCRRADLESPAMSAKAIFDLHRTLDFRDYCHARAEECSTPTRGIPLDDEYEGVLLHF